MPTSDRPRPIKFGNQRTKKQREADERARRPRRPGTLELIAAYVIVQHKGVSSPCPNIDRARIYAREHGTKNHPVIVLRRGKEIYRYPE